MRQFLVERFFSGGKSWTWIENSLSELTNRLVLETMCLTSEVWGASEDTLKKLSIRHGSRNLT